MPDQLTIRVRVLDVWDRVELHVPPSSTVADVKQSALRAMHIPGDPAAYLVKFRGAEMRDESRSMAAEGVPDEAALIVLRRRRVPVL